MKIHEHYRVEQEKNITFYEGCISINQHSLIQDENNYSYSKAVMFKRHFVNVKKNNSSVLLGESFIRCIPIM